MVLLPLTGVCAQNEPLGAVIPALEHLLILQSQKACAELSNYANGDSK